jgi:hypothetical protein
MANPSGAGRYASIFFPSRLLRAGSRMGLVLVAAIFAVGIAYRLTQLWLVPEIVIAVPATEPAYEAIFAGLARVADPTALKLQLKVLPDLVATTEALDRKEADFAVVRTDVALPDSGLTVAQLRDDPVLVIAFDVDAASTRQDEKKSVPMRGAGKATEKKEPKEESNLRDKRIAVFADKAEVAPLVSLLMANDVPTTAIRIIEGSLDALESALRSDEIDAVAVVSRPHAVRALVASMSWHKSSVLPVTVPTPGGKAPLVSEITLRARSLGPNLPEEDVQTAALSWRLVAHKDVERVTVAAFLQSMFSNRIALAKISDLAWPMKGVADEDATFARIPNHRGALDYYNREQQTFMDLYGDWLWIGLFAAGGVSSGLAWLVQLLSRRRKQLIESILDRLLEILSEARRAVTVSRLDELTVEIDGLVTHAVRQARWRAADAISTTALTLAIDSSRAAITDRRERLLRGEGTNEACKTTHRQ